MHRILFLLLFFCTWNPLLGSGSAASASQSGEAVQRSPERTSVPAIFRGDWRGDLVLGSGQQFPIRIVIEDGSFTQYFRSDNGWRAIAPKVSYMESLGDTILVGWLNQGGVWTENQMFSLTFVRNGEVQCAWTRHVTNRQPGQNGDSWNARGEGVLKRQ